MPALNFQARWAADVESGAKRTTIRRPGRAKPSDILYLYTGQRTKGCRRLGVAYCLAVTPIRILDERNILLDHRIMVGGSIEYLARIDTVGQLDEREFVEFFRQHYGLPFDGELIAW